jgi:nitrite reductase (cytochrome c-552)
VATREEMRAYVCGQCHVEYYFQGAERRLVFPWSKGIEVENIQAYYDEIGSPTGPTRPRVRRHLRHSIPS